MIDHIGKSLEALCAGAYECLDALEKAKPALGSGKRFARLKAKLARRRGKGKVKDPAALAAAIGAKKYGRRRMQRMAAAGRRKSGGGF